MQSLPPALPAVFVGGQIYSEYSELPGIQNYPELPYTLTIFFISFRFISFRSVPVFLGYGFPIVSFPDPRMQARVWERD